MPADKFRGMGAPLRGTLPLAEIRLPKVNAYGAPSVDQTSSPVSAALPRSGAGRGGGGGGGMENLCYLPYNFVVNLKPL